MKNYVYTTQMHKHIDSLLVVQLHRGASVFRQQYRIPFLHRHGNDIASGGSPAGSDREHGPLVNLNCLPQC